MTICVTGGTGFLGTHVVRALAERGEDVRVLVRDRARMSNLAGTRAIPHEGDVLDAGSLRRAFRGCDAVMHVAGVVGSSERAWRVNAQSPEVAVAAAAAEGVRRVVLTSSVVAIGPQPDGQLGTEDDPYRAGALGLVYLDSKHEGEARALAAALHHDVDLVVVNPAYVLGAPVDRSSPGESSARRVLDFLAGRMPAILDAPTNVVDVRDVATAHVLALDRGRRGERYIAGGHNVMWREVVERAQAVSGRREPVLLLPRSLATAARATNALGLGTLGGVGLLARLAAPNWQYSSAKAERELGYRPRPLDDTLRDAWEWFRGLVDAGLVDDRPSGAVRAVRAGQRAGLVRALRAAGRVAGRPLVVGG